MRFWKDGKHVIAAREVPGRLRHGATWGWTFTGGLIAACAVSCCQANNYLHPFCAGFDSDSQCAHARKVA